MGPLYHSLFWRLMIKAEIKDDGYSSVNEDGRRTDTNYGKDDGKTQPAQESPFVGFIVSNLIHRHDYRIDPEIQRRHS
jgi:hypothetical protein